MTSVEALLFDGRSARPRPVTLRIEGAELVADAEQSQQRWPLAQVRWPERTRHGQRVIELADGRRLQCPQPAAFDAWAAAHGRRDGLVVRLQQSWRAVLLALLASVLVLAAALHWGVPLAARGVLALLPPTVDQTVGERAWQSLQDDWFKPSRIAPERQAALRQAFGQALAQAHPPAAGRAPPAWRLEFRAGDAALGPNALALPGGIIVVTDALVELLADRPDALLGVLGHEWGHVRQRHGMQGLLQASLVAGLAALVVGDFSSLLAAAPALLAQQSYARGFEREADAESVRLLRAAGHSPAAMVVFFQRIAALPGRQAAPVALASHPADAERLRYFEDAARR
jgi:Zn-dependent protease with chaperone function